MSSGWRCTERIFIYRKNCGTTMQRKPSKFRKVAVKKRFDNRFQKFYYTHRPDLNKSRRMSYSEKKKNGICVKCKRKALKTSIFCAHHRAMSRVYNRRR
jgi:hypothetical protein